MSDGFVGESGLFSVIRMFTMAECLPWGLMQYCSSTFVKFLDVFNARRDPKRVEMTQLLRWWRSSTAHQFLASNRHPFHCLIRLRNLSCRSQTLLSIDHGLSEQTDDHVGQLRIQQRGLYIPHWSTTSATEFLIDTSLSKTKGCESRLMVRA
jgi:hypothetical protein